MQKGDGRKAGCQRNERDESSGSVKVTLGLAENPFIGLREIRLHIVWYYEGIASELLSTGDEEVLMTAGRRNGGSWGMGELPLTITVVYTREAVKTHLDTKGKGSVQNGESHFQLLFNVRKSCFFPRLFETSRTGARGKIAHR